MCSSKVSIPVIANPYEDISKQIFPDLLSNKAFCTGPKSTSSVPYQKLIIIQIYFKLSLASKHILVLGYRH